MRPKKHNRHLPACVYLKHGAYYYVKNNKWTRLGDNLHDALVAHARIVAIPKEGVASLITKAMPFISEKVAPSTRKQYQYCERILKEMFAEFTPEQVTHGSVVQMLDVWRHSPATANRLLTVLKQIFQWALDREIVDRNPCESVKRLTTESRDRLITQDEFDKIHAAAPDWLQVVMDLCYYTGQRIGDVLTIRYADITEEGIYFEQQKTGKKLTVGWSEGLQATIERAALITKNPSSEFIVPTYKGTARRHTNVWRFFKESAAKAGVENVTLHDLRAMSGTDADREGKDPMLLLGHTDRKTTQIYLRDKTIQVVSGPTRKQGKNV
ncbi:integrase [Alcaligenaceae bacterium 429]|nr:integrase [Alcaligenaceae bacterium 429]